MARASERNPRNTVRVMSRGAIEEKRGQAEAIFAAINARDFEALGEMQFHRDMEFHSVFAATEGRIYRGTSGLREWAEDVDSAFEGFRVELLDLTELDAGRAILSVRVAGRARASGIPVDQRLAQIWTWRDGQLWRNHVFTDTQEAFRAAGVAERVE